MPPPIAFGCGQSLPCCRQLNAYETVMCSCRHLVKGSESETGQTDGQMEGSLYAPPLPTIGWGHKNCSVTASDRKTNMPIKTITTTIRFTALYPEWSRWVTTRKNIHSITARLQLTFSNLSSSYHLPCIIVEPGSLFTITSLQGFGPLLGLSLHLPIHAFFTQSLFILSLRHA